VVRRIGIGRIGYNVLLLRHAVQTVGIEDQILGEAFVKQPKTGAQYGFRGALPASAYAPGNTEPRRPVRMIVNRVLRFKAQTTAQREVRTHLPVVLHVQSRIHHRDGYTGSAAAGGCIDGILAWHTIGVIPEARE